MSIICLVYPNFVGGIGLEEFVPEFLRPSSESYASNTIPVKPLVEVKRNSSEDKSWYCNRNKINVNNVFCKNNNAFTVDSSGNTESKVLGDRTAVVDNSIQGSKIGQNTIANPTTLQDQEVKNTLQKQNGFLVPIAPSSDVKMNVNQQQIQFNNKY